MLLETVVTTLVTAVLAATLVFAQTRPLPACRPWQACQQLAVEAAARDAGEEFHDLAWRAVQLGPPNDPQLLWLLARAQSASGRFHDALVLVRRLAEMGVATSADSDEAFAHTRALPGWPDVAALIRRLRREGAELPRPPQPVPAVAASVPSVTPAVAVVPIRVSDEPLRFSTTPFTPGGLAYDAVSRRFIVGDAVGRRLMVVGLDTKRAVDMVRSDSARFRDVAHVGIDETRGDLWVTSRDTEGASALHRLQLISGRPLRIYQPPTTAGAARLGDVTVTRSGLVVVLDQLGRRLMTPTTTGLDLRIVSQLDVAGASVTVLADDRTAYVAHADGIVRVNLQTGSNQAVVGSSELAGLERIRAYRDGLVGVQRTEEGRRLIFLPLSRRGTAVGTISVLAVPLPAGGDPPFVSVLNDEVAVLVTPGPRLVPGPGATTDADARAGGPPGMTSPTTVESIIHRIRLP